MAMISAAERGARRIRLNAGVSLPFCTCRATNQGQLFHRTNYTAKVAIWMAGIKYSLRESGVVSIAARCNATVRVDRGQ